MIGDAAQGQVPDASDLLALDEIRPDRFRARHNLDNLVGATFGGQALSQALAAAQRTTPDWPAHNASGLFLRAGKMGVPVDFTVERVNDSRRFAARRVLAGQDGQAIFDFLVSFHAAEEGPAHQAVDWGDPPPPEGLPTLMEIAQSQAGTLPDRTRAILAQPFPIEMRPVLPERLFDLPDHGRRDFWFRIPSAAPIEGAANHQALLLLMSDYWLPGTIASRHNVEGKSFTVASLNHSFWFHAPARADQWLLYRTTSDWAGAMRGLARGHIFARNGTLVATAMQEALLRPI